MPLYEYICDNCKNTTDELISVSDSDKEVKCKKCDSVMRKLVGSGIGFMFKGDGFYSTEYGKAKEHRDRDKAEKKKCGD